MDIEKIHPELRKIYSKAPNLPKLNGFFLRIMQALVALQKKHKSMYGVTITEQIIGAKPVRIYSPEGELSGAGLLWIHGGGYIFGSPQINDRECALFARDLKLVVVSVGYRLPPKYPFPSALDDCFTGWQWFVDNARSLSVDPQRIVVSGQSAGGGLAAALVQRIHDSGGVQPAGQGLFCPMLDDRTATKTELDPIKHKLWTNASNRMGWQFYLNQPPGLDDVPDYAVPARREDLTGLPPAWIGIGDIDLFHDEDCEYARRLRAAGVACELEVFTGCPHGFEILVPEASITRWCWDSNYKFLRRVLNLRE